MEVNKSLDKINKRNQNKNFFLPPINKETNIELTEPNSVLT